MKQSHKLTKAQIEEVVNLFNENKITQEAIGRMYGITLSAVSKLANARGFTRKGKPRVDKEEYPLNTVPHEFVLKKLSYDQATGIFKWNNGARAGTLAGGICSRNKYHIISIGGASYGAHRLAWFYVHKRWPIDEIDHINGNRSDNRISNLRECTRLENGQNTPIRTKRSKFRKGVTIDKDGKYVAGIGVKGKTIYLGYFNTLQEAILCREEAEKFYQGEFRRRE